MTISVSCLSAPTVSDKQFYIDTIDILKYSCNKTYALANNRNIRHMQKRLKPFVSDMRCLSGEVWTEHVVETNKTTPYKIQSDLFLSSELGLANV